MRTPPWYRRPGRLALLAAGLALAAGLVVAARPSEAPAVQSQNEETVPCVAQEMSAVHIHAHLQIYVRGQARLVPANVGVRTTCLYWLHTHDASGLIHVEAGATGTYTLGQFFAIWGQTLGSNALLDARTQAGEEIRALVDGQPFNGDLRSIPLRAHGEIVLELGPPFPPPTPFTFPPGT